MAQALTPYLIVRDAAAALDWYVTALGAIERSRWTGDDGRIGHSELAVGEALVYVADEWPEKGMAAPQPPGGTAVTLHLSVVDADHAYERAVAHGAQGVRPPEDAHGDRVATVVDPFGHRWMFYRAGSERGNDTGWQVTDRRPAELGYLVLGPPDLERATAFYGQVFDWRIEGGAAGGGHVANTRFPLGLSPQGDGTVTPLFRVDDLDVYVERVTRSGGDVRARERHDSGEVAQCVDDQGLRFDLWRPATGF